MHNFEHTNANDSRPWLVTGGAGYIGAHVVSSLKEAGIPHVSIDIDQNSALKKFSKETINEVCDIRDVKSLEELFARYTFEGIIHLAALKSVEESQKMQTEYFETNVQGTQNILEIMSTYNVRKFIFSSSAAVYEAQGEVKLVHEASPVKPISYYGQTKLDSENLILEYSHRYKMASVIFRYFNVAGSASPLLNDKSTQNLIPITINKIKSGEAPEIFGDDYDTPDGTPIRDFVDVRDIADAHLKAIYYLSSKSSSCVLNIGTEHGASVKEVISLTQEILGTNISPKILSRRSGDISAIAADCRKAKEVIGFQSKYSLREMIETSIS